MNQEPGRHFANMVFRAFFTTLGAVAEILAISMVFNIGNPLFFIVVAFFLISIAYLWDFYRDHSHHFARTHHYRTILAIILLVAGFFTTLYLANKSAVIFVILALIVLGGIYDRYIREVSKRIWAFRDIFIMLCWNIFIFLFLAYSGISVVSAVLFFLAFVLSRDFVNIAYCDIKDIALDEHNGQHTFATLMGANRLINVLTVVNIFSIILIVFGAVTGILPTLSYFLIAPVMITTLLVKLSHSTKIYSTTTVDFEYYTWLLFILIGKLLV